jgi:hypothetical protein
LLLPFEKLFAFELRVELLSLKVVRNFLVVVERHYPTFLRQGKEKVKPEGAREKNDHKVLHIQFVVLVAETVQIEGQLRLLAQNSSHDKYLSITKSILVRTSLLEFLALAN